MQVQLNGFNFEIIFRKRKRVTEKDIYKYLYRYKGRPTLPASIITTIGYTEAAAELARKRGILLLTVSHLSQLRHIVESYKPK